MAENRAALIAEINANVYDNTTGAVRELDERELRFETNVTLFMLAFVVGGPLFVLIVLRRGRRA